MVNFRVIRVKVVVPEKLLDVNIIPKITLMPIWLFTLSQNILVLIWQVAISKNTLCWFRTIGQNEIIVTDIKPMPFSLSLHLCSLPLSPICNISFSLSVLSAWFPSMFYLYWFHIKRAWCSIMIIIVWLTINVWGHTCCFTYTLWYNNSKTVIIMVIKIFLKLPNLT